MTRVGGLAFCAVLTSLVCVLAAVDFAAELGTDYGAYFSHGWFITQGLIPHGDFWTHKPPLLPILLAGWIALFGAGFRAAVPFPPLVTIAAASVLYLFARTVRLPRASAVGAALLFAFIAASHGLDPTRNGVIVIAAVAWELFALVLTVEGVRANRSWMIGAAGLAIALGLATRQTAAVAYVPAVAAIAALRGRAQLVRAVADACTLSVAVAAGAVAVAGYLLLNGVTLGTVWDQIYRFNALYAAGYHTKLTWWGSQWLLLVSGRGLAILVVGTLGFAWWMVSTVRRHEPPGLGAQLLAVMAASHLAVIYLSQKVAPMYLFQLLPELCLMTAMTGAWAWRQGSRLQTGLLVTAVVSLLAWPGALEVSHWRTTLDNAREGGYLLSSENLPSQALARRIQQYAPRETDRIWIFSASSDALYPFSRRLPAGRMTSVAGLVYETSPNDFERWRGDFESHDPRVVLSFYGDEYVRRWQGRPEATHGQTVATILQIRRYLLANMRRIDPDGGLPEVFVPLDTH